MEQILKAMSEGLKTLSQAIGGIADKVDQMASQENKAAPSPKPKAKPAAKKKPKAKVSKKKAAPKKKAKPKVSKKKAKPKAAAKKAAKAPRKTKKKTSLMELNALIAKYPDGVDTSELKKKTDFDDKKIHNIVYKLKKQGEIKSLRKGIYVSTS